MAGPTKAAKDVLAGSVLEVLSILLAEGKTDEVLAAVEALVKRNEELEQKLASIKQRGQKPNEGVSRDQLDLFLKRLRERAEQGAEHQEATEQPEEPEPAEVDQRLLERAEAAAQRSREKVLSEANEPKQRPMKKPLPAELPRREHVIDVPEDQRACPSCGTEREVFDSDVAEVLELEPAKLFVRVDKRLKRKCPCCEGNLVRAPRGGKVVEGGQIGCSVVAKILSDKYELGLTLHRLTKVFGRMGMPLSSSTACDQVRWGTDLLYPLWLECIDQVLDGDVMHIDGSGVKVLDRDHPNGKRLGTLWATIGYTGMGPKVAAYYYAATKKANGQRPRERGPTDILAMRSGITVADADSLFEAQMQREDIIDCGCNMHARRYFVKALDGGDDRAALVIGAFKGLYQVEEDARLLSDDERLKLRRERSTPIYNDIVAWCHHHLRDTPPRTPLGRAIAYLLRHEQALRRFEHDGRIPIDNMLAEHAFVPVALTRKNFLFFGHDNGGDRAAIIYSVLHSCRLAGADPAAYLTETLSILSQPHRRAAMSELMPAQWAARKAKAQSA